MFPALFDFSYFEVRSYVFTQGWPGSFYFNFLHNEYHHAQLLVEMGNFLQGLTSNYNLPNLFLLSSWDFRSEP
jgi:hypothetical protein